MTRRLWLSAPPMKHVLLPRHMLYNLSLQFLDTMITQPPPSYFLARMPKAVMTLGAAKDTALGSSADTWQEQGNIKSCVMLLL